MSLIIMPEQPKDLVGRMLALNIQICKKFQCGGFWLNVNKPFAVVEPNAQQDMLHRGLIDGRLLDITDQSVKGLQTGQGGHTAPKENEEKGAKVYFQLDTKGNVLVIAPKNEAEEEVFEKELQEKGTLHVDTYEVSDHGLGGEGRIDSSQASDVINNMANKIDRAKSDHYKPTLK
jgi:hypothetical protein